MDDSGAFTQLGFVVKNLDESIKRYSALLKIGPFVLFDFQFEDYRYLGRPSESPVLKVGICFRGEVQYELMQQVNDVPSPYRHYARHAGEGLQHVGGPWARSVEEYRAQQSDLLERGYLELQSGLVSGADIRFSYFSDGEVYPAFEIADANKPAILPIHTVMRDMARDWDGKRLTVNSSDLASYVK
jgi:Glyoxalase/Bleomycin resistance protein/Dioxygenase superfamily